MRISKTWLLIALLLISVGVRLPGLFSRAIWYDEAITLLETSGHAVPSWPQDPVPAKVAKTQFVGTPSPAKILMDLRDTDVHPPVYFWLLSFWRRWFGFSLETARAFSLICSVGTVLVLYLLLQAGKFEHPFAPTLIFGISSGAIFAGQEARPYALASFLIVTSAFFAYLASEANDDRRNLVAYSIAMALCGGLAFYTNYLALFPVLAILLWFLIHLWHISKPTAIAAPLLTGLIWVTGTPILLPQLGARSHQVSGFLGVLPETIMIIKSNLFVIWYGAHHRLWLAFVAMTMILIGASTVYAIAHRSEINQKLLLLFLGLACAPSIEIFLLDLLFNKHLSVTDRYFLFAGPAIAVVLAYGLAGYFITKPALIILIGLQLAVVNWGVERTPGWPGSNLRSLVSTISEESSRPYVVVVGAGYGRGDAGSVIYELDPETNVVVLGNNSDLEKLQSDVQQFDEVWIVPAGDNQTAMVEGKLLNQLREAGYHMHTLPHHSAIHLWKQG